MNWRVLRTGKLSFASGLFRFRGSVSALRVGGTREAVEIGVVKSGFGRQSVLRLRFVPFPWFCSGSSCRRNTRGGGTRGAVEIELRNQASVGQIFSRLRFVPFPWFCSGSSGRRNTRGGRNRGCEIGLRQAERPSPSVCSVSVVLFRLFMSAEHSGRRNTRGGRNRAAKSSCEIELRNQASVGQIFSRLRFVPFPWFCFGSSGRRNTRGGQNRAAKSSFGVRNVFRNGKLPLIISLFII